MKQRAYVRNVGYEHTSKAAEGIVDEEETRHSEGLSSVNEVASSGVCD